MELDFSDFNKKFDIVNKAVAASVERGMGKAGIQLLNDCVLIPPTVPIKEGWLRGSGSVFVENNLVAVSTHGKKGKANEDNREWSGPATILAVVGFNTPYAAKLHEGVDFKFTEPSSGPKYLESKLISRKEIYGKIIADEIRGASDAK